jgi:pyruvate dehydrogenase E1 component
VNAVPSSVAASDLIADDDAASEIQEWIEAFDDMLHFAGPQRCLELLKKLQDRARSGGVEFQGVPNTPYCNTIPPTDQASYPGNLELERRIAAIVRWNALALVVRANKHSSELGGHLASFASGADLFEVGFNHFLRGDEGTQNLRTADMVFFQPHSAPGIYARAFLEGRLTEERLDNFRREVGGKGLSSYPHPRLMPGFWQFPTGSMGLGPLMAVYQARFMRYLQNRGLLPSSERKVWAFVGDGEMDEPESLAGLSLAVRENLDNLIFVVNCNLQRLDGPVRGNGSIIQGLERLFSGVGCR